tara:strand:- start:248 stop:808 length:561 start_codon:yes stop_codon:yes gene_type:complete
MIKNEVDALTLQYFINNKFERSIAPDNEEVVISSSERKFYKKRIIQLTKDLFKKAAPNNTIQASFNNYLNSCISYFKFTDASDLMQEEYDNVKATTLPDDDQEFSMQTVDEDLFNMPTSENTLDSFVTNKTIIIDKQILPKSKLLNITNEKFKTKGIKKKKKKENIENIYGKPGFEIKTETEIGKK